ncbi:MAG: tyrosine--tRNA ligase [Acidimicrobiia bacterium]
MLDQLLRGTERVVTVGALKERLGKDRPLRVKLGVDPTAPAITLGWAVVLRKLRQFQEFGHTAVLIIGDFTAQVGDPSGKSETRRRLSVEEVDGYADRILDDFATILLPEPLEVRRNSEWLADLDMVKILELTSQVTVAQMLERGDFAQRYQNQAPISLMEFLYPLLQGMDSVAVEADVELGGSDQLWNLMMGRVLQERAGQEAQIPFTMPLLIGTDGVHKMSQSLGNYIAIDDEPDDMFGKVMSIPDEQIVPYFELCTDLSSSEVAELAAGLSAGTLHPANTKRRLARAIVDIYHDLGSGVAAERAFDQVFKEHRPPEVLPEFRLPAGDPVYLPAMLKSAGLVGSSSDARRLIDQGGVKLDGETVNDLELRRDVLQGATIQVGKRRFVKLLG